MSEKAREASSDCSASSGFWSHLFDLHSDNWDERFGRLLLRWLNKAEELISANRRFKPSWTRSSTLSSFNGWVKALELETSIHCGKAPVDGHFGLVALMLPGVHLGGKRLHGWKSIGQALPR